VTLLAALAREELDGMREHGQEDLERLANGTRGAGEVHDER